MPQNKNILIDILPRIISILGIMLSAQVMLSAFDEKDLYHWSEILENTATSSAQAISDDFSENLTKVYTLSEDNDLLNAFTFAPDNIQDAAKKVLYEFKYLNNPQAAYIYDARTERIESKTTGAPAIPSRILSILSERAANNKGSYLDVLISGRETTLLYGGAILSATGTVEGYALYAEPFTNSLDNSRGVIAIEHPLSIDLIQKEKRNTGILFESFSSGELKMRQATLENTPRAIFADFFNQDFYQYPLKGTHDYLISAQNIKGHPEWMVIISISKPDMKIHTAKERRIVWTIVSLIALLITLMPISGPYTELLKKLFAKLRAFKLSPKEDAPKELSAEDLEKMRIEKDIIKSAMAPPKKMPKPATKTKPIIGGPKTNTAEIAYNIRLGMKNKRVKLLFQPIFDTQTHTPVMHETYMRIIEEDGSIIPPSLWLPVAKKENLFSLIDETVLSIATKRFFMTENPLRSPLTFNISGSTFESLSFMEMYTEAGAQERLSGKIIFEISSKEMISDARAINFIRNCRNMGFRFSVDYFGGGVETLNVAKSLKFDFMKINAMRFDLDKAEDRKELLLLAKTAQHINLPVIVERIEDKRMYIFCKKIGVPYTQGYFLGEPKTELLTEAPKAPA